MVKMTEAMARAAGQDAGNRSMIAGGRSVWSAKDFAAAAREMNRLMGWTE